MRYVVGSGDAVACEDGEVLVSAIPRKVLLAFKERPELNAAQQPAWLGYA
jgi:hypothetical protein